MKLKFQKFRYQFYILYTRHRMGLLWESDSQASLRRACSASKITKSKAYAASSDLGKRGVSNKKYITR